MFTEIFSCDVTQDNFQKRVYCEASDAEYFAIGSVAHKSSFSGDTFYIVRICEVDNERVQEYNEYKHKMDWGYGEKEIPGKDIVVIYVYGQKRISIQTNKMPFVGSIEQEVVRQPKQEIQLGKYFLIKICDNQLFFLEKKEEV